MWRSVGFLMSFAVVLEGLTVVSYLIVIAGSKTLRENGWKALSLVVILGSGVQAACMAIVVSCVFWVIVLGLRWVGFGWEGKGR